MAITKELQILLKAKDEASKVLSRAEKTLDKMKKTAKIAATAISGISIAIGVKAVKSAADFEKAMSDVNTLYDDNGESAKKLGDGIKELLKTTPKSAEDLGSSAYQIVSAGITEVDKALSTLKSSSELAVAGLGTTEEATDILTSAMNTFKDSGLSADEISNILFKTVKAGKTTISDLSQAFGATAPIVESAGIQLDDFQAATAALTTTGLPASQAQNALRGSISALIKPTSEMQELFNIIGVESGVDLISTSENLGDVFGKLKDAGDKNNISMADAFGRIEGLNAVIGITDSTSQQYKNTLDDMKDGTDKLKDAFDKQNKTAFAQYEIFKNQLNVVLIKLGEKILPPLIKVVEFLSDTLNDTNGFIEKVKDSITNLLNWIDSKTGIITILKQAFDDVVTVFKADLLPNLKKLWDALQPLMPFIETLAKVFGVILYGALIAIIKIIEGSLIIDIGLLNGAIEGLMVWINTAKGAWDSFTTSLSNSIGFIDTVYEKIKKLNVLQGVGNTISGFLGFGGEKADGGSVQAGTSYIVGERGPEMFTPSRSGTITPNNQLGNTTININNPSVRNDGDIQTLVDKIQSVLGRQLELSRLGAR